MLEWWTYSLSDFLLFSPRTYYRLLELYNLAVWPLQVVAVALGAAILALLSRDGGRQARAGSALLAACWLWVAWAYLWERYDTINWAASYFAVGFGIQSLLLTWSGVVRDELRFRAAADITTIAGLGIFLYALVVHPLIAPLVGRPWLQAEVFAERCEQVQRLLDTPTSGIDEGRMGRLEKLIEALEFSRSFFRRK